MSGVLDKMKSRRSVRAYRPDMVPQEILDQIVEAGLYAASGKGCQDTIIIQVTNKELRDKIAEMNCKIGGWKEGFDPFYGAPAMLIVLAKKDGPNRVYDGSLVMGNLMLAAHELGVGSCWIHRAREEFETEWGKELLRSLGMEGEYEGIGHCALGYADGEAPKAAERKANRVFYVK
ncbi:MAG: nitroreductase family protein [Oscillospiraceae bacterium]|nr:nitroreductase family protein [Oscillospiraceae bacterium]